MPYLAFGHLVEESFNHQQEGHTQPHIFWWMEVDVMSSSLQSSGWQVRSIFCQVAGVSCWQGCILWWQGGVVLCACAYLLSRLVVTLRSSVTTRGCPSDTLDPTIVL